MIDVVVVGGGIAGVSAAYYLAEHGSVTLVEREPVLAYHTTGRSAAQFVLNYGHPAIRPLTAASRAFFDDSEGLADDALLSPRPALTVARPDQLATLGRTYEQGLATGANVERIEGSDLQSYFPQLRRDYAVAGLIELDSMDIDVATTHQAFVRGLRRRQGRILTRAPVSAIDRDRNGRWKVHAGDHRLSCTILVNAAGAWGDEIAVLARARPIGLAPLRRTAFMVRSEHESSGWAMLIDADHEWYLKPDGPQFLCSPADETPTRPGDARPQEIDVAIAIERITRATTLPMRSVASQWAGLRTFAPDRSMVIGWDPEVSGFLWLVGQGGTGIQTAPAAGRLVASIARGAPVPDDLTASGIDVGGLDPSRFH